MNGSLEMEFFSWTVCSGLCDWRTLKGCRIVMMMIGVTFLVILFYA